jgi:N-acetylglucosaminyl-diphospho-decaprenol L-rhamnosyltransferase
MRPLPRQGSARGLRACMHDLAVIIVSTNEARWLEPCLRTLYERGGDIAMDVVIADNQSTDGTRELVETRFPEARVVTCANHGFSHANNRGVMTTDARYVLFLNPDTEIREGQMADMVAAMDARPQVGLAGVRQLTGDGELWPTIRRFPNAARALGEALASEQIGLRARWAGEREMDMAVYDTEVGCDWTSGSFMFVRREALESSGYLDERFFIYSEETDLCLRIKQAGWEIRHLPQMTIVHHADKAGISERMEAQGAYARRQYAFKHFSPAHAAAYLAAVALRYLARLLPLGPATERRAARQAAARRALLTLVGRSEPPFGDPPPAAVRARDSS